MIGTLPMYSTLRIAVTEIQKKPALAEFTPANLQHLPTAFEIIADDGRYHLDLLFGRRT
jgi:hypothetical protein